MNRRLLQIIAISVVLVVLSACSTSNPSALNQKLGEFTAVNQDGETVTKADFEGKIWVASFFFTHCITVCPSLTANMALLQQEAIQQGVDFELVSFTVDPEKDKPEIIKAYLEKFDADFSQWQALTGYSFAEIQELSQKSFKSPLQKEGGDSDQFIHGTSFYLIDRSGVIVDRFSGLDVPTDEIISAVKKMK
ncbi:SCO family protein [Paenibacillus senegalensis]|uniref:SCO family protein n=1 Tax=Paenibacillus senegalensis TaxID=1465766 RepID=UPI0002890FDC|nr:SCO family protein [Paenibacillus senegalensis]